MRAGRLSYDGTTYTLSGEDVEGLLGRGLIVPDAM